MLLTVLHSWTRCSKCFYLQWVFADNGVFWRYSYICYTGLTGSQLWHMLYSHICYTGLTGSQLWHTLHTYIFCVDTKCLRVPSSGNFQQFSMSSFSFPYFRRVATLGPTSQLWPDLTTELSYMHSLTRILSPFGGVNCTSDGVPNLMIHGHLSYQLTGTPKFYLAWCTLVQDGLISFLFAGWPEPYSCEFPSCMLEQKWQE